MSSRRRKGLDSSLGSLSLLAKDPIKPPRQALGPHQVLELPSFLTNFLKGFFEQLVYVPPRRSPFSSLLGANGHDDLHWAGRPMTLQLFPQFVRALYPPIGLHRWDVAIVHRGSIPRIVSLHATYDQSIPRMSLLC